MCRRQFVVVGTVVLLVVGSWTLLKAAEPKQLPLAPGRASGLTISPAFEGWYENADGTFSLCFGYYNRNTEETVEIPLGPDNFIEPTQFDGDQPLTS